MEKDILKKITAALFFIGGLVLTIWVVLIIGQDKGLTAKKFQLTVYYKDVAGLIEGAPVRISGVNVGTVDYIGFLKKEVAGRQVEVILNIFEKYRAQLDGRYARFAIKTEGILGQKLVEIYVNTGNRVVALDRPILGDDSVNVEDLAEVFSDAAESFTKTSGELSKINIKELGESFSETARSVSETSEKVDVILIELERITLKSKRLLNRVEQKLIDGTLLKLF